MCGCKRHYDMTSRCTCMCASHAEIRDEQRPEWRAGDLALVTAYNHSEPYRAFFDGDTWRSCESPAFCVDRPTSHRPLLVINPEDREQVARLEAIYDKALREAAKYDGTEDVLQAALREFAADPKPEEPTGLGAVVLDSDGNQWVRVPDPAHPWVRAHREEGAYTHRTSWPCVDAVEVLAAGWSA